MKEEGSDVTNTQILEELRALRRDFRLLLLEKKDFYTVPEMAFLTGHSVKTVRNKDSDGTFPIRSRKVGGRRVFKRKDWEEYRDSI